MGNIVLRKNRVTANTLIGKLGELTINTTDKTVYIHDGSSTGGFSLFRYNTTSAIGTGEIPFSNGTQGVLSTVSQFKWDIVNNRLGIGISPATKLHVASAANDGLSITSTDGSTFRGIFYNTNDNQLSMGTTTAHVTAFYTNNLERARINAIGDILIGNATDAGNTLRYLDVYNTNTGANAGTIVRLVSSDVAGTSTAVAQIIKYKNGLMAIQNSETNAAALIQFAVGNSERMRIDSSGNVLIGSTTNWGRLYSQNSGGARAIAFSGDAGTTVCAMTTASSIAYIGSVGGGGGVGTELCIDLTNSRVGIGTTSPGEKLHVAGNIRLSGSTSGTITLTPTAIAGTTVLTLPATTGTLITTGDTGTVTSTMILDGTIVNGDISASAAIAVSKLAASTISGITLGSNLATLTIGTGLSGTSYNGSTAVTIANSDRGSSQNIFKTINVEALGGSSIGTITAASNTDSFKFKEGNNITLAVGANNTITITANVSGGGSSGVTSLNSLSGALSITSTGNTITVNPSGSTIDLSINSTPASTLTGTIPSGVLGNSTVNIGTTAVLLNRASANLALTGITNIQFPGSTSGTITLTPTAIAGTTTLTLPATTGTIITTGDTGTVTSTMILDGTIVNADINASAAIAVSKLAASTISGITLGNNLNTLTLNVSGTGLSGSTTYNGSAAATFTVTSNATSANTASAIVARDASGNFSAGTITATLSGSATSVGGITEIGLFNNMGQIHTTRSSFDATTPSYNFGYRFVQGSTNGPGTSGSQFYSWYIGLGSEYPATGAGSYGAMFAVDRNVSNPYLSVRYNEANGFTPWYKIRAGVADSVANAAQTNITSVGTLTSLTVSGNTFLATSSGSVGIGTTSPGSKLTVVSGDAATATNQVIISGGRTLGSGVFGSAGSILFTNSYWNSGFGAAMISALDSGSAGGHLAFATLADSGGVSGTPTERMRILQNGNVGIGTTSPGKTLDIISAAGSIRLAQTTTSGYGFIELGRSATATNNWHFGSEGNGALNWYSGPWGAGNLSLGMVHNQGLTIRGNNPTLTLQDTDNRSAFIHCNSNLLYVLRGSGTDVGYGGWATVNGVWPLVINLENNDVTIGGTCTATTFSGAHSGSGASLTSIPNSALVNSSVTVNGTSISLGSSATITANTTNSLTFNNAGTGAVSGTTFNGSATQTISYNTIGAPSTTGTGASGSWGISITGSSASCIGNSATATTLQTSRNFSITGPVTANNISFNGSGDVQFASTINTTTLSVNLTSERVGIGTTSPSNKLHVVGNTTMTGDLSVSGTLSATISGYVDTSNTQTINGAKTFSSTITANISGTAFNITQYTINQSVGTANSPSFAGLTVDTNTLYVDATNDRVGIGLTNPSYKLHVSGDVYATGDVYAGSDIRMKENVLHLTNALEKVKTLQGYSYNKIGVNHRSIGLIAQDVEKIIPEVVSRNTEGMKGIDYGQMIALLVEAIKELSTKLETVNGTTI